MTSVPDHGGKLIQQVADDESLTHTPTRKTRDDHQRGGSSPARKAPRRRTGGNARLTETSDRKKARSAPQPRQHQQMDDENV
jgi:hypothetical protein